MSELSELIKRLEEEINRLKRSLESSEATSRYVESRQEDSCRVCIDDQGVRG